MRWEIRRVFYALVAFTVIVLTGGVGFWAFGAREYSLPDSIYFALSTAATVGFAELPHLARHPGLRVISGLLIVAGIGAIAFFQSTLTAVLVEGVLLESFRRRRMQNKIKALQDHLVVAGVGRTGKYICEELDAIRREFVVIDKDEELLARLNEEFAGRLLYVVGDATEDHTLIEAGLERAHGVMAALSADKDNLFIVLSARALNPRARIVSKVIELENEPKIVRAGADQTVSPHRMGGMRMVSELVRPKVTEFLDRMLRVTKNLRFEEVEVPITSRYASKTLREVPIRQETRLLVVALHEPDGDYVYNPEPDHPLHGGTGLIVMGEPDGVQKLRELVARA
ncbi:MAG TPA: potassium channel protein [Polyangiaceae bacterium]|jgi:voltage-gated potassium channel